MPLPHLIVRCEKIQRSPSIVIREEGDAQPRKHIVERLILKDNFCMEFPLIRCRGHPKEMAIARKANMCKQNGGKERCKELTVSSHKSV